MFLLLKSASGRIFLLVAETNEVFHTYVGVDGDRVLQNRVQVAPDFLNHE